MVSSLQQINFLHTIVCMPLISTPEKISGKLQSPDFIHESVIAAILKIEINNELPVSPVTGGNRKQTAKTKTACYLAWPT